MGFSGYLEVENTKKLPIVDDNEINYGKPLVAFLSIYRKVDRIDKSSLEKLWFTKLESLTNVNLRILARIFYGGEWNYSPDEYQKFIMAEHMGKTVVEEDFKRTVVEINNMWTSIDEVIIALNELHRLLPIMGNDTYWYSSEDTLKAIFVLIDVVNQARKMGGKKVRIQFL